MEEKINELIKQVEALVYYSQIHTVKGVRPAEMPDHETAWRKAQRWLWDNCKADEMGNYHLKQPAALPPLTEPVTDEGVKAREDMKNEERRQGAVWVKASERLPEKHIDVIVRNLETRRVKLTKNIGHNTGWDISMDHLFKWDNTEWLDESTPSNEREVDLLTDKERQFLLECNLYPHAEGSLKVLTESDEGSHISRKEILTLANILYRYAKTEQ